MLPKKPISVNIGDIAAPPNARLRRGVIASLNRDLQAERGRSPGLSRRRPQPPRQPTSRQPNRPAHALGLRRSSGLTTALTGVPLPRPFASASSQTADLRLLLPERGVMTRAEVHQASIVGSAFGFAQEAASCMQPFRWDRAARQRGSPAPALNAAEMGSRGDGRIARRFLRVGQAPPQSYPAEVGTGGDGSRHPKPATLSGGPGRDPTRSFRKRNCSDKNSSVFCAIRAILVLFPREPYERSPNHPCPQLAFPCRLLRQASRCAGLLLSLRLSSCRSYCSP
jgi:hypothetical protein